MALKLKVLEAHDSARTQWNYITTIIIAGMGFFTDAYNLFCISIVSKLLGCLYCSWAAFTTMTLAVIGVALLIGTLTDHLIFGWIADKLGVKELTASL